MHKRYRRCATVTSFGFGLRHEGVASLPKAALKYSIASAGNSIGQALRVFTASEHSSYQPQGKITATLG